MANSRGSSNIRNLSSGKALLPPKSPFPSISPAYVDYFPSLPVGSKAIQKPREGNSNHQRTSSESFLMEEQPSWLDDLLNEPETPVRRGGHRRSSSDSFAYVDAVNASGVDYSAQDDYKNRNISWSQEFDHSRNANAQRAAFYTESNSVKQKNRPWDSPMNALSRSSSLPSGDNMFILSTGSSAAAQHEADRVPSTASEKHEFYEPSLHDAKALCEKKDSSHAQSYASDSDTKRAKQQFAQRSRVRKLQYIAELERNVQALQAEGSEVSAELEFRNQQNLILSMENKALKQRLESIAQEKIIKYLEQEVLEREIARLRALYQQQQQPQQPPSTHRRSSSRDLDSQFSNLSLKQQKDSNSGRDPVSGPLSI